MPEPKTAAESDDQVKKDPSAEKPAAHPGRRVLKGMLDTLTKYWQLMVALVSVSLALIGWVGLGVSPLEGIKEIQQRTRQRLNQQELARRHVDLGNRFLDVGQAQAAEAEFRQAKELDRYSEEADLGLLKASVFEPVVEKEYSPEIAERRIEAILQLEGHKNDTHALAYLGDVWSNIDPKTAMDYYERALASNKQNAWAYYGKGLLAEEDGKRDLALEMYEKAIEISPWNQSFLNNAAYQYYLKGLKDKENGYKDYEQAEKLYREVLNLQSDFLLSYATLALTEMMKEPYWADGYLEPLEEKLPSLVGLKINQGLWMFQLGEGNRVYLYSPEEKIAYLRYLLALARQLAERPEDARRELQKAATEGRGHDISRAQQVLESDVANIGQAQLGYAKELHAFKLMLISRRLQ